jgi:hypothetical protein
MIDRVSLRGNSRMFFHDRNPFFRALGMTLAALVSLVFGLTNGDTKTALTGAFLFALGLGVMIYQLKKPLHWKATRGEFGGREVVAELGILFPEL